MIFLYQFYPILDDFWSFIVCCSILNCQKFGKINLLNFLLKPLLKKYAASQNRETEFNKTLIHHYRLLTSFIGRGCNYFFCFARMTCFFLWISMFNSNFFTYVRFPIFKLGKNCVSNSPWLIQLIDMLGKTTGKKELVISYHSNDENK